MSAKYFHFDLQQIQLISSSRSTKTALTKRLPFFDNITIKIAFPSPIWNDRNLFDWRGSFLADLLTSIQAVDKSNHADDYQNYYGDDQQCEEQSFCVRPSCRVSRPSRLTCSTIHFDHWRWWIRLEARRCVREKRGHHLEASGNHWINHHKVCQFVSYCRPVWEPMNERAN